MKMKQQQQQHPTMLQRSNLIVDTTTNNTTKNTNNTSCAVGGVSVATTTTTPESPQTIITTKSDADATVSTELNSCSSSASFSSVVSAWSPSELECHQHNHRNSNNVTFGYVQVREYERIIGDHDDLEDFIWGPPLAIGWKYKDMYIMPIEDDDDEEEESKMITVDEDEYQKRNNKCHYCGRIKQQKLQPLNGKQRRQILQQQFDIPKYEIDNYIQKQFTNKFDTKGWIMHIDMFFAKLFFTIPVVENENNNTTTTTRCCKRCLQKRISIVQKKPTTKSCFFLFC